MPRLLEMHVNGLLVPFWFLGLGGFCLSHPNHFHVLGVPETPEAMAAPLAAPTTKVVFGPSSASGLASSAPGFVVTHLPFIIGLPGEHVCVLADAAHC